MTLILHARTGRPPLSRHDIDRIRKRPELMAALTGLAAMAVQLIAGWPGWLAPATLGQWTQARSGPFTDAYPVALTWFWAQLDPAGRGPLVPFLLQLTVFWIGVVMLAIGLQPAPRWTRFIPALVLLVPFSWLLVVVCPGSAAASLIMAGLGLASLGLRAFRAGRRSNGTVAVLMSATVLGAAALGAGALWFAVLPVLLLLTAAVGLAVVPRYVGARARLETVVRMGVITMVAAVVAVLALPAVVVGDVGQTRGPEAVYALDAFHVDCAQTWSSGRLTDDPVSPPGLWVGGRAPCGEGSPGDFATAWAGFAEPTSPRVLGFGAWLAIVAQHPATVIGGRLQHATAMLGAGYPYGPDVDGGVLVSAPGSAGAGDSAGMPNRGGLLLGIYAAITALLPGSLLVWALLVPLGTAVWWVRKARRGGTAGAAGAVGAVAVLPVLLWPPVAALLLAMATPFDDPSVMAPAALLGPVLAMWAVGAAGVRMPARDTEILPYGGPYPGTLDPAPAKPAGTHRLRLRLPRPGSRRASDGRREPAPDLADAASR